MSRRLARERRNKRNKKGRTKDGTLRNTRAVFDSIYSVPAAVLLLLTNFQPIPMCDVVVFALCLVRPAMHLPGAWRTSEKRVSGSSSCFL